jgi:hypothetical protein
MSMAAALHLPLERADESTSAEYLYGLESAALKDYTVVPIAVVPEKFSASRRLHDWFVSRWGEINWGNIWMESSP